MSDIHAGPDTHHPGDGLCTWVHEFGGERLRCDEAAIPGTRSCPSHYIIRCTPRAERRRFPPTVVHIEDVPT